MNILEFDRKIEYYPIIQKKNRKMTFEICTEI